MNLNINKLRTIRRVVSGYLDYFLSPKKRDPFGGPLNGQQARRQLFDDIIKEFTPKAIIETGTYRGVTTAFFAQYKLPVFTIEISARNYGFASAHLRGIDNVSMYMGDSAQRLKSLFQHPLSTFKSQTLFAYLDAHWEQELPLADEIDVIFTNASDTIVMIDDFEVPGDPGYSFDDYGPDKALTAKYIEPMVQKHQLSVFYPSTPSDKETSKKRGCVVLCKTSVHGKTLSSLDLLIEHND